MNNKVLCIVSILMLLAAHGALSLSLSHEHSILFLLTFMLLPKTGLAATCSSTSYNTPVTHLFGSGQQQVIFASFTDGGTVAEAFPERVLLTGGFSAFDSTLGVALAVVRIAARTSPVSLADEELIFRTNISKIGKHMAF